MFHVRLIREYRIHKVGTRVRWIHYRFFILDLDVTNSLSCVVFFPVLLTLLLAGHVVNLEQILVIRIPSQYYTLLLSTK